MIDIKSKINSSLTLSFILGGDENNWFDRKSARVRPADLAPIISAFANAEGGTIALGVDEKTREIEGIDALGQEKVNALLSAPKDCCKPMPSYQDEMMTVKNQLGVEDHILLLHIHPSLDQVIRTSNDSTFLRIGDRTKELRGEDLRNLEYNKGLRHYEDEISPHVTFGIIRVMAKAPEKKTGEDGLPIPPYKVYNIGGGQPENLLDFVNILQEELVRAGVLPRDYDFEAHKELVPMQPGDVPTTYADATALERDFGFTPKITLREGLRHFAEWYKEYYG